MDDNRNVRQTEEVTIDLMELLYEIWNHKITIILVTALVGMLAFLAVELFVTPQYTSETSLYVLAQQNDDTITTADLSVGTQLTSDYVVLVTSRPVLESTIANLNLDLSTSQLKKMISVSAKTNTRILTITVTNPDPILAKNIADCVREEVGKQIVSVMNIDAVNMVEDASLPTSPSSPNVMRYTMIGALLGAVLSAGIVVVSSIMDDTIKSADDVEKYIGVPLLGTIPLAENKELQTNKGQKKSLMGARKPAGQGR